MINPELSASERRIAECIASGLTDKQIAADVGLSTARVRQLLERIARKWSLDRSRSMRVQIATRVAVAKIA